MPNSPFQMTKDRLEFFKSLYEEETTRFRDLIDRGKIILSLVTLYTGFMLFVIEKS